MNQQKNEQKLTFNQLMNLVAEETDLSKQFVHSFTKELVHIIKEGLKRDGKVNLSKLGIFELKQVQEREGRDPETGDPITIPAHQKVVFKPYKKVRKRMNAPYEEWEATFAAEGETPSSKNHTYKPPAFLKTSETGNKTEKAGRLTDSGISTKNKTLILASGIAAFIIGWSIYKFVLKNENGDET